jgi:hypothetical protein
MRSISANLACAAENGSKTAKTLSSIASKQAEMVDPLNPMESQESLQAISALTKISNDAAQLGMGLININKAAQFNGAEDEATPARIEVVVKDARRDDSSRVR